METRDLLLLLGFSEEHIKFIEQLDITNNFEFDHTWTELPVPQTVDLSNVIVDKMRTSFITEPIHIKRTGRGR